MGKDLYAILGVTKTAGKSEIKSAYHKLARKYHPDVNKDNPQAAEKFKEISAAYDILGDDTKRAKYDNNEIDSDGKPTGFGAGFGSGFGGGFNSSGNPFGGANGFRYTSSAGGKGADFDFSSLFGEDIFSAFSGSSRRPRARKGEDIAYTMKIDFLTAARGGTQQVTLNSKNINVKIPAGTIDGQTIRLKGLGNPGHMGGESGDVLITLNVAKHPYFSLDGQNVILELPISMKEAVLGAKIVVPTIDGSVALKIPPYAGSGDKLRLKGKGLNNFKGVGDQIVVLKVMAPQNKNPDLEKVLAKMPDENVRNF
ncbi:MAG: J domain-containing protein [Alphaproteobacteria bacterium]|nr:J domain-containing protein [Alphaproteobacteria bacterium]